MTSGKYDEIRAQLARRLGHEPKEEIWDRLVDEAYVREVWEETAEIDYLEENYREFNRVPRHLLQPPKRSIDSGIRQIRLQILSDLAAKQAATEKSVIAFRRQHLPEGLLKREEVVEWIERQAVEEGGASHYLSPNPPKGYDMAGQIRDKRRRDRTVGVEPDRFARVRGLTATEGGC